MNGLAEQTLAPTPRARPGDAETAAKRITIQLLAYCRTNHFAGYDPYDALNSRVFASLPLRRSRLARLAFTQCIKRLPFNVRPMLGIPPSQNPKGIALFLSAAVQLADTAIADHELIASLASTLLDLRSAESQLACWGYNFDWQSRAAFVRRGVPNVICTAFAGNALLDAHEKISRAKHLEAAASAARFMLAELYSEQVDGLGHFNYFAAEPSRVHNANLLGAAFICRVAKAAGEPKWIKPALKAARYSVGKQHPDGSWNYGEERFQSWKDNFHTGYNLCALDSISRNAETTEFDAALRRGFEFYHDHFLGEDGAPHYYHDRRYPLDIHSAAQSIITFLALKHLDANNAKRAALVAEWTTANMWDERGYFYYQKLPCFTIKTPFMRWSQAWMLLALSHLLSHQAVAESASPVFPT